MRKKSILKIFIIILVIIGIFLISKTLYNHIKTNINNNKENNNNQINNVSKKEEYISLKDISKNYTKEEAIKDNCFVIENNKIISSNINQLEEFIEKSEQNIESSIRVAIFFDEFLTIKDIKFKNGKYIICDDDTRGQSGNRFDLEGNYMEKVISGDEKNKTEIYYATTKENNQIIICTIKL